MQVTIWGCRGSLPSPGEDTLRYGGNTTCLELRINDGQVIIIDGGSGMRCLGKSLLKTKSDVELDFVLTHTHWDHLMGFPFFTPAYFSRFTVNVYGGPQAQNSLKRYLSHQMEPPFFPVDFTAMKATFRFPEEIPTRESIGGVGWYPIPLSHPNGGYGFKFVKNGKSFVFLTDNELGYRHPGGLNPEDYVEFCRGADVLLHDAQYTDEEYSRKKGWGHSTFAQATELAIAAKVKRFGIFHHDPDRTDDELDVLVEWCQKAIKKARSKVKFVDSFEGTTLEI